MKFKLLLSSENKFNANQTSSNFENYLYATFAKPFKMRLISASIPLTYYNVNNTNNKIYLDENPATATLTLTNGVYNTSTLASHLKTVLDAGSPGGKTYTVSYNNTTNSYLISVNSGTFRFRFNSNNANSAYKLLGFPRSDGTYASSQTSSFQPQLNLTSVICLRSNELSSRLIRRNIINQNYGNILYMFPVTNALGEVLTYYNNFEEWLDIDGSNMNKIDISLTDLSGNILDLRGIDTFFEFEIETIN